MTLQLTPASTFRISAFALVTLLVACVPSPDEHQPDLPESPALRGPYFGQPPPGSEPEVFAPGVISFGYHEHGLMFAPDGSEAFYVTSDAGYKHYVIIHLERQDDIWSPPEVATFSGRFRDGAARFSPDGSKLFFSSKRPLPGEVDPKPDADIWMTERTADGWLEPANLGGPVNSGANESRPSISSSGTLYFHTDLDADTAYDIYASRFEDGRFQEPEKLNGEINTEHNESAPFIDPNERYLLFQSNRPGGFGSMDLYVSFRQDDGGWGPPMNLGPAVNSAGGDFTASVSSDGKYLFFGSYRRSQPDRFRGVSLKELLALYRQPGNGYGTQYWVRAEFLEKLNPQPVKAR